MKRKLIIVGAGKIADVITPIFAAAVEYEIVAYACESDYIDREVFHGRPVIPLETLSEHHGATDHEVFVAIGYHGLNQVREQIFLSLRQQGYRFASCIHPGASYRPEQLAGDNIYLGAGVSIETAAVVEEGVFLWSNAVVGHHARIAAHAWLAAGAVVGGASRIGLRCFLGLGAVVGNEVDVADDCLLGANTLTTRSLSEKRVVIARDSEVIRLDSGQFLRMSSLR